MTVVDRNRERDPVKSVFLSSTLNNAPPSLSNSAPLATPCSVVSQPVTQPSPLSHPHNRTPSRSVEKTTPTVITARLQAHIVESVPRVGEEDVDLAVVISVTFDRDVKTVNVSKLFEVSHK